MAFGMVIDKPYVERAFSAFVEVNGRAEAIRALEEATGFRDLEKLPEQKYLCAAALLVGRLTTWRQPDKFAEIRARAFGKPSSVKPGATLEQVGVAAWAKRNAPRGAAAK